MIQTEISRAIASPRQALLEHELYRRLQSVEQMRAFMEFHVFAVWDFMSLLKVLQQNLTCVRTPWLPAGDARIRRLVNEIVLGEESDVTPDGQAVSHSELYLKAMDQAGANTRPILRFVELLSAGSTLEQALESVSPPDPVKAFVRHTFSVIDGGKPHEIAAAFTYGREDLIPDMFGALVSQLQRDFPGRFETFRYYLDRHIELDGDEHGEMGRQMVALLCGGNVQKEREAAVAARAALQVRLNLWDGIAANFNQHAAVP